MDKDEYREVIATFRHYSSVRFAALTLFSGATAGLIAAAFGDTLKNAPPDLRFACRIAGLVLAVIFICVEFAMASYLRVLFEYGMEHTPSFLNRIRSKARWQRVILHRVYCALYVCVAASWIWALTLPR